MHRKFHEELYMKIPTRMDNLPYNFVCNLKKSLYGLKQALRQWYEKL